ncbi:MAG: tetratricopeptide repeat protein, partial [Planctomycetes bacterium]|nr:tetratricopeptide repeat protein [Planctomycetota bacterium]
HLSRFAEISFQLEQLGLTAADAASAETIVKQALVEQPDHPASQMLLARILHAHGKSGEAEKLYQKTAPALADDGQALLALSMAYRDLGDKARAAKAAKLAVQTEPWNKRVAALSPLMVEAGDAAAASAIAAAAQPSSRREGSVVPAAVRTGMEKPQPTTPLVSLSETVLIPTWDVAEAIPGVYLEEIRTTNADAFVAAAVIPDSNVAISPPPQDKTVKTESGGRLVRIRPGEAIRIDSSGAVRTELMDAQGIRASVGPKVSDNAGRKSQSQQSKWPRAEVRIPYQPLPKAKTGPGVAGSKNTISAAHPAKPVLASETALAAPSAWRKEKTEAIDEESPLPPSFSFSSD